MTWLPTVMLVWFIVAALVTVLLFGNAYRNGDSE